MGNQSHVTSNKPDAIPDDKVIEWPLNASREWHQEIFGERAAVFVRQVAELVTEQKLQALMIEAEAHDGA